MNREQKMDLFRYEGRGASRWRTKCKYLLFLPPYRYIYYLRRYQAFSSHIVRFLYAALMRINSYKTHIQIPPETSIGSGLYISHWGRIIINQKARIGRNLNISAGVLIGSAQGKMKGVPVIGDNVVIGANACIIGNCHIGNDVLIAPGAFVNFDVPDNSIVIGNPGRIIQKDESPTKKYIVYPVDLFRDDS